MNSSIVAQPTAPAQDPEYAWNSDAIPASAFVPTDLDCWAAHDLDGDTRPADPRVTRIIAAVRAGVRIITHWHNHYRVASGSAPGTAYTVTCWTDSDDNRHTACNCPHGTRYGAVVRYNRGTQQAHTVGKVCRHMILVHFARLSEPSRAALLAQYPDLSAALSATSVAGQAA